MAALPLYYVNNSILYLNKHLVLVKLIYLRKKRLYT